MQFSVVIPLFNKGPHVLEAIRSVYRQTCVPHEVIIVDDGSTDGGLEKVRELDLPNLRVLTRSPPGPGGYAARNLGIESATGEWIAFLDADDIWYPDHLEGLQKAFEAAGGGEDIVCAFSKLVETTEGSGAPYPFADRLLKAQRRLPAATIIRAWLQVGRCPIWTGAVAIRRRTLIEQGLFPAGRATRGGDKDMWLRAILSGYSVFWPKVTVEFRQDTVNRVTNTTAFAQPPVVVSTIADLLHKAGPADRALFKRLSNQEVALYAWYSATRYGRVNTRFLAEIHYPQGFATALRVLFFYAMARPLSFARRLRDSLARPRPSVA